MESGFVMLAHALLIILVLYLIMCCVLGQNSRVAEDRSVLLGGIALVYMVLYGHGMPSRVNPAIF